MVYFKYILRLPVLCLTANFFMLATPGLAADPGEGGNIYIAGALISADEWRGSLSAKGSLLDTNYSIPTPGTWPAGVTREANFFWNTDADSARIYKLTFSGNVIQTFEAPGYVPAEIEWDGTYLWLVDEQEARLYKIDPVQEETTASFSLPDSGSSDPNSFGLAWDGANFWHSQYGDSARIFKLDPSTGGVLSSFESPADYLLGITWDGTYLAGIDIASQTLYRIDPASGEVIDDYPWPVPYPLGLFFDGLDYWNVSGSLAHGGNQAIYRVSLETGFEVVIGLPGHFVLIKSYPNPFNNSTRLDYYLPRESSVVLDIYNIFGQRVANLIDQFQSGGEQSIGWEPVGLSSGIYFARLKAGESEGSIKLMLLK